MTREPITVTPDTGLKATVKVFIERKVGALPVVVDSRLVGIVTEIDLLRVFHGMLKD
jgi:CBS domain-containing protein